jgi:hypothetical protein
MNPKANRMFLWLGGKKVKLGEYKDEREHNLY